MRSVIANIKQYIFPVISDSQIIGTAFLCHQGYLITCHHVVSGITEPYVDVRGELKRIVILASDNSTDIAICTYDGIESEDGLVLGNYDDLEEGDETIICGFPLGISYHVSHFGRVSAKQIIQGRFGIQIDASVNKGNSGSPCITATQSEIRVVGIVATRLVEADFTKISLLLREYEKANENLSEDTRAHRTTKGIVNLFKGFAAGIIPTILDLNRYVNVGFGEAVSIQYAKDLINTVDISENN